MNSYDIANDLIVALKADTVFVAAATALLGKAPTYYVGFDNKNPPAMSAVPFVVAVPGSDTVGDNNHRKHGVMLACVCNDDTSTTALGITRYRGYSTVSQFAQLLDAAMKRHYQETDTSNRTLLDWTDISLDGHHPDYHAMRELTVITPYVSHIVTFQSNGGSAVAAQEVFDAQKATTPTAPTKTGFTFAGWYSDAGLTALYDFDSEVTSSFTLYAKWT